MTLSRPGHLIDAIRSDSIFQDCAHHISQFLRENSDQSQRNILYVNVFNANLEFGIRAIVRPEILSLSGSVMLLDVVHRNLEKADCEGLTPVQSSRERNSVISERRRKH
jgi:hypothetical protein